MSFLRDSHNKTDSLVKKMLTEFLNARLITILNLQADLVTVRLTERIGEKVIELSYTHNSHSECIEHLYYNLADFHAARNMALQELIRK